MRAWLGVFFLAAGWIVLGAPAAVFAAAPAQPADVALVRVDVRIDSAQSSLQATARLIVAPHLHGRQPLHVLLARSLALSGVTVGGAQAGVVERRGLDPQAFWDQPDYEALADYRLTREVSVTPPDAWPDTVEISFKYGGVLYDSLRAPEVAYARSFEQSLGLVDARGVYLAGSSFWVPTLPGRLYPFDLSVDLPEGWRSVSQGRLAEHHESGGRAHDRWICPSPMEQIYIAAGPLTAREVTHGGRTLYTFTHAPDDSLTGRYLDAAGRDIDLYESLYGPYPFAKFALVENFWETGYGMPSFTLLGEQVIRLPFILDTSYAHEILHNWWGNGVFVDAESGNWCEGLTAFGSDYRVAESKGEGRDYRQGILRDYLNYVRAGRDLPLTAFRERENAWTQAVGYGKSTMVFLMLRRALGAEAFDAGLRAFYRDNLFRLAGWRELLASIGRSSGQDLERFRAQWVERPGAPSLAPGPAGVERTGRGFRLKGTIRQREPAYELDVPVRIETAAGDTTISVAMSDTTARFVVDLAAAPRSLWVDPEFELFRRLERAEIPATLSQTLGAESTLVVIANDPEFGSAFDALAREWSGRGGFTIERESEVSDWTAPGRSVWVLGRGSLDRQLEALLPPGVHDSAGWSFEGTREAPGQAAVVVTMNHPRDTDQSVSWFVPADSSAVASIGRKIPHYGKYSYLAFEGTRNVAKGVWEITDSPMRVSLEAP